MSAKAMRLFAALCLLVLLSPLCGCANSQPILVGFAGELNGKQSDLGVQGRNGAQLAIDALNAAGGISGRPLRLVVHDDLGTPEGAATADRELIQAGVVAIVGHMSSAQTLAGLAVTAPAQMVLLSPAASTPQLTGLDDWFFRVTPTALDQARSLATHVAQDRGLTRVALIYDTANAAYTESYAETFTEVFEDQGRQVINRLTYASDPNTNMAELATALKDGDPDGVIILASALDTALLAQAIRQNQWTVPLFTSAWAQTSTLLQNGGRAVDGLELVMAYDTNSPDPAFQDFKARYLKQFGQAPTFAGGEAYEAVMVLAAALRQTRGQPQGLREALLQTNNFDGLIGKISLDAYGDAIRPLFLVTIQDGAFVTTGILASPQP